MMSDPEKNTPEDGHGFPEEEYRFNEEEPEIGSFDALQPQQTSEQPSEAAPKKKLSFPDMTQLFEKIKIKPILDAVQQNFMIRIGLIIGLVLLIVGVIYSCSSNPIAEKSKAKVASIPVSHFVSKPPEVAVSKVPAVNIIPKAQTSSSSSRTAMNQDQYMRLEKANADLQSQLKDLSSQISNLRSNVDTTTASLKLVAEQLSQLATTVGNDAKARTGLLEQIEQQKSQFANKMAMPAPQLQCSLQAIIPGRAWLNCSNGETLTVSQGTRIGPYGEVRYIDATSGRVLTSSGQTITFSQDDS